jgi:hypothetical protein
MSVITNVTVPVGNRAAELTLVGTGSEVGLEIGIADINPAGRGGERLGGQAKARGGVPPSASRLSTAYLRTNSCIW